MSPTSTVIAGNHTLQAAMQLGWSDVAVVFVDDDDDTARAFALADNRTAELGTYDREYPKPSSSPDHPTQKPIDLIRRCVRNITAVGELTIDPFLGSGTTLLAAHLESRVCYGMEMDPRYVDVICKRYQLATGVLPIAEATGNTHDFCGQG